MILSLHGISSTFRNIVLKDKLRLHFTTVIKRMVVFTQKINGVTGVSEWDAKDDNYDYHQEIARAGFADMLHDTERNQKYFVALKAAIDKMHSCGKMANVLDIGTGTGLLSMMAAQCGADSIVACEAFQPMSECALDIIKDNGYQHAIRLIPKRSTDITVGEHGDLKCRANILVTEVFDTELIGEGAIETFSHAHRVLLEEDCIVVPHSATVYAQLIECPTLFKCHKLLDIADEEGVTLLRTPPEVKTCSGSPAVHDIQLSQLGRHLFKEISQPLPVLHFDWSGKTPLEKAKSVSINTTALHSATTQMVFMWWDLSMDPEGKVMLSCAPWWNHPDVNRAEEYPQDTIPWRDHWMQAVYYFPTSLTVSQGEPITLVTSHDEYSLWFSLCRRTENDGMSLDNMERPVCTCGVHMTHSRTHISCMNDNVRNKKLLRALRDSVSSDCTVLCLNGASPLGLVSATMGIGKLICLEPGIIGKRVLNNYISFNQLKNVEIFDDMEAFLQSHSTERKISVVFGDPNYATSILPWDSLRSAYLLHKYKDVFAADARIIPSRCSIWTMAVQFLDLHKIKSPLAVCENVDLKLFDALVEKSRAISDSTIEPHPLWEYPCVCRTRPIQILTIDVQSTQDITTSSGKAECQVDMSYNGFAFWIEWDLNEDPKNRISTGPVSEPLLNERVQWDPHTRQGVQILDQSHTVREGERLKYNVECNLVSGNIHIDVQIN